MRLHEKVIAAHGQAVVEFAELTDARDALADLESYLLSEKFHTDTTVQVRDVLARLAPLKAAILGADAANADLRDLTRATAHAH